MGEGDRGAATRRRALAAGVLAVPAVLALGFGHGGTHAARSALVPGAGLVEARPALAAVCFAAAVAAAVAWMRWGTDWVLAVVVVAAMATSAAWGSIDHGTQTAAPAVRHAAHEIPLAVLVLGFFGWLRGVAVGLPGLGWLAGRRVRAEDERALGDLPPVDRCRAAAVLALAGAADADALVAVTAPDVERRAARVGLAARLRTGGDPLRGDHAHARAALALLGALDEDRVRRFVADARRSPVGVPASEPTWVRPLDATLAAIALHELGIGDDRWAAALRDGPMAARRGHRPAWLWTPLGVAAGRAPAWEHAAATALAHHRGWIGTEDWPLLRQRVLGAAARGSSRRDDERLIAAGRLWLSLVDDPAAAAVVARPTVRHDPLAVALDRLADHLRATTPVLVARGAR